MSDTRNSPQESIQTQPDSHAIAPVWHTAVVLLLLLGLTVLGIHSAGGDHLRHMQNRLLNYGIAMAFEWLIFAFIWLGARWQGPSLRQLAGRFSPSWRSIALDLGLAIGYLLAANLILQALGIVIERLTHSSSNANELLKNLLPHTALECAAFLLLSLTAGICEELIFRGYLQRQFTAWTRNAAAGIVLQGIVFGVSHAYQGPALVFVISVYGCMFGLLAWWRKSLRPGMAAHFIQDAVGGLVFARYALK
jgi:uncharacterized protein